jgi:TonB family protein
MWGFICIFIKNKAMKNYLATLLLLLIVSCGFSQNQKFELTGRGNPAVKKEKLSQVQFVNDLTPDLWSSLMLPSNERYFLNQRRVGELPQPKNYVYPQDQYKLVVDVVSVKISASCKGKMLSAESTSDKLSAEQKSILSRADLGTDISIKLKFKYKDQSKDAYGSHDNIVEGESLVTVVPETEAEFPGGFKQMTEYFAQNVLNKIADKSAAEKVQRAIVKFIVNEQGEIVDAKITRTSTDTQIDQLLLEATNNMPKWKPAVSSQGIKVKQQISIPADGGGC